MTEQEKKPDAVVRFDDFDVTLYRRGKGLLIRVRQNEQELGFFGIAGATGNQQETTVASAPASIPEPGQSERIETPAPLASPSPTTSEAGKELSQPVKIVGLVAAIEGMGQTPTTGDPVFRFSVKTGEEEIKQIAAFRQIGQTLDQLTRSPDPNMKLQPGRPISMMAFDHTAKTGSYYPSSVTYLSLPAITNPKRR